MMQEILRARNAVSRFFYTQLLKRIFFTMEPERIHDMMLCAGAFLGSNPLTRTIVSCFFCYSDKKLEQNLLGIKFRNPVGLAAGFDKNARLMQILPAVGFGFSEVGSITGEPCEGNPKPRVWRLKKSGGLLVNYGLKNDGCEQIAKRLLGKKFSIPLGTNIAKANTPKTVALDAGISDYAKAYGAMAGIGSYSTINISCPNAYGGEPFTDAAKLDKLLKRIDEMPSKKPVFIKMSPDLTKKQIDAILKVAARHKVAGIICTNLTKKRDNYAICDDVGSRAGGVSGKPLEELSNECIRHVYSKTRGKFVIIGCGGVFSAEDAYKKIRLGASLVQLITGMIFEGPQLISEINLGLVKLLEKDGLSNISEAVGKDCGKN